MAGDSQVLRARLHLLGELHAGTRTPGAAIVVKEVAASLRLSHTPVREALAILVGEELVTATGDRNGFAVPRFSPGSLSDLIGFVAVLTGSIVGGGPVQRAVLPDMAHQIAAGDPAGAVEATVAWLIGDFRNLRIVRAINRIGITLAPYRRTETVLIPNWPDDLGVLVDEIDRGRGVEALDRYWTRRIDLAAKIVDAVERPNTANIFGI